MIAHEENLLRLLAAGDETAVRSVVSRWPALDGSTVAGESGLPTRVAMLVVLAALLADDACTASLCWAAELAAFAGADNDEIVGVLLTVSSEIGVARLVSAAPRLALALGYDIEVDGWDGS